MIISKGDNDLPFDLRHGCFGYALFYRPRLTNSQKPPPDAIQMMRISRVRRERRIRSQQSQYLV